MVHPRTVPSPFLLSGLLFCSCGRALTGQSAKSGRYFYYVCSRSLKHGTEACNAGMLPKEKIERLVIEQLKARVLTDDNMEELVKLVNEELQATCCGLKDRLDAIDTELQDVRVRLGKLYEALETGKLDLNDLAPRIKELKIRQDELVRARVQTEAEMAAEGTHEVDMAVVKTYAQDLRGLLEEADLAERKVFLRSFVRRIDVNGGQVTVHYALPMPPDGKTAEQVGVLPIVTFGGAEGIRTPDLLNAIEALSQLSYSPLPKLW